MLLNAPSECEFNRTIQKIYDALQHRIDLVDYMKDYERNRQHFASYIINATCGTVKLRGSSIAEANHASYVARIGQASVDDISLSCKSTLQRQFDISVAKNEEIAQYKMLSDHESNILLDAGKEEESKAMRKLTSWGLELQKKENTEWQNYEVVYDENEDTFTVSRKGSNAQSDRIIPKHGRCPCNERVGGQIQCRHEMCIHNGRFIEELFDERWYRTDGLNQSHNLGQQDLAEELSSECDTEIGKVDAQDIEPCNHLALPLEWFDNSHDEEVENKGGENCHNHLKQDNQAHHIAVVQQETIDGYLSIKEMCSELGNSMAGKNDESFGAGIVCMLIEYYQVSARADDQVAIFHHLYDLLDNHETAFSLRSSITKKTQEAEESGGVSAE
ncbi:MAG: hypothetical protein ACREOZ_00890, partial [Gloeomargaritales cyanobacterium]